MRAGTGGRESFRLTSCIITFVTLLGILLDTAPAHALKVAQAKGNQVLLSLESGDSPQAGDLYFVMIGGKKLGLVQVTKVQGKKALAKKTKGRADVGAELSLAKAAGGGGGGRSQARGRGHGKSGSASTFAGGFLIGMNSVTQNVSAAGSNSNTSVSMNGSSYSVKGTGDLTIAGGLGAIGRVGIENLSLTGSANGGNFNTSIMYLSGDLLLRYNFDLGSFTPFVAAGMGLHMPMSKSSNALQDMPMMTVVFANVGAHYTISSTSYVTALVEYGLFPPSSSVTTNFLAVRAGMGFRF